MSVRDTCEEVSEMKAGMLKTRGRWFEAFLLGVDLLKAGIVDERIPVISSKELKVQ